MGRFARGWRPFSFREPESWWIYLFVFFLLWRGARRGSWIDAIYLLYNTKEEDGLEFLSFHFMVKMIFEIMQSCYCNVFRKYRSNKFCRSMMKFCEFNALNEISLFSHFIFVVRICWKMWEKIHRSREIHEARKASRIALRGD